MTVSLLVLASLVVLLLFDRLVVRRRLSGMLDIRIPDEGWRNERGHEDVPSIQETEVERARGLSLGRITFHVVGLALVLNSLITYLNFFVLFKMCTSPAEATCLDSHGQTDHFLSLLVTIGYINLALRFMAGGGFFLDSLAVLYIFSPVIKGLFYLARIVIRVLTR